MEELICFDDFRGDCSVVSLFAYIYIYCFFFCNGALGGRGTGTNGMSECPTFLICFGRSLWETFLAWIP